MGGPDTPQGVADLAQRLMDEAGLGKLRKDAIRAIEAVFSLPPDGAGIDQPTYFAQCVEWSRATFGPILSADVHRDEAAPHLHVLCLPLINGRMVGSDLVGGPARLRALQTGFHAAVPRKFGLKRSAARLTGLTKQQTAAAVLEHLRITEDPALKSAAWPAIRDAIERDPRQFAETIGFAVASPKEKPAKSFAAIMTGTGKGARTPAEADKRDRALMATNPIGFGGVGDQPKEAETGRLKAPAKTRTLCSVGFAHPTGVPAHSRSPATGHAEGGAA